MNFYQESYFNRQNWILDNLKRFNLSVKENIVLIMINFYIEQNRDISVPALAHSCNMSESDIDQIISVLSAKSFLQIQMIDKKLKFTIDNIFHVKDVESEEKVKELFELFEEEFGRVISERELNQLQKWLKEYDKITIINALREASVLKKLNFQYIDQILFSKNKD